MGNEGRTDRMDRETFMGSNQFIKTVTATYQMLKSDVHIVGDSTAAAFTITLPSMAEAAGRTYSIEAPYGNAQDTVLLVDKEGTNTIATMDADDDNIVLYCTGKNWRIIFDGIA